jgi:VanZ family protein
MQTDKLLHLLVGALIVFIAYTILPNLLLALALSITVGFAKEVYDKFHPNHTSDIYDFYATAIGALAAATVIALTI